MTLRDQLTEDMKNAMRAHDTVKLGAVRFLIADIRNYEIDNGDQDDAGIQKLIAKQVKQMKDAIAEFEKGDRQDLIAEEQAKIAILQEYLPEPMALDQLKAIVAAAVADTPDKNMGLIMSKIMPQVAGKADGATISQLVRESLQAS